MSEVLFSKAKLHAFCLSNVLPYSYKIGLCQLPCKYEANFNSPCDIYCSASSSQMLLNTMMSLLLSWNQRITDL